MSPDFHWGAFGALFCCLLGLRLALGYKRTIPVVSVENAVFMGFVIFFGMPIGFLDRLPEGYGPIIILGFASFGIASFLVSRKWNDRRYANLVGIQDTKEVFLFALIFVSFYLALNAGLFVLGGGSSKIREAWLESVPIKTALGDMAQDYYSGGAESASVVSILLRMLKTGFLIAWGVVFARKPKIALICWTIFILLNLVAYQGRSVFLILMFTPLVASILTRRIRARMLVFLGAAAIILVLPTLSVLEDIRSGRELSSLVPDLDGMTNQLFLTTSVPVSNAVLLEQSGYRGSLPEYLFALAIRPIPVFLWPTKPVRIFNYESTFLIYQRAIGPENPISTFTMYGEGQYYGGRFGFILLMALFGLASKLGEKAFAYKSGLFIVPLVFLIFNSAILLRSTFLDYYSYILNTIIPLALVVCLIRVTAAKTHAKENSNRRSD